MSWDVTDLQASHLTWNILYNIVLHLFTALILSFGKRRIFRLHVSHQTGVQITTTWLTAALFSLRIRTAVCRMRFRGSNRYCVRPFSDLRGVYKGNMASILSPVSVKTNHHKDGPLDGLEKKKKKTTKSFLLYSNGRVFVCRFLMWVNVSGSQSGGLHPASDGPYCSLKTPLCVIETC